MPFNFERWGVWVNEMDVIPKGYGVAWYSPWSCRAFCMRVPFNRIVGSFRAFYLELQRPCEDDPVNLARTHGDAEGFQRGYTQGKDAGIRLAMIAVREEFR